LMDEYITNALVFYTLAELSIATSFQLYNKGLISKTSDNTSLPDMSNQMQVSDRYRNKAEFYAKRMNNYLMANRELYPEYVYPGVSYDTVIPMHQPYQAPMYLGCDYGADGRWGNSYLPVSDSMFKNKCREC